MTKHPTLYSTASRTRGGLTTVYRVIAQNAASHEQVTHLLLRFPGMVGDWDDQWVPVSELRPVL